MGESSWSVSRKGRKYKLPYAEPTKHKVDLKQSEIALHALLAPLTALPTSGIQFNRWMAEFEARLVMMALRKFSWNKTRAAEFLGINRTGLVEKCRKYGLMKSPLEEDNGQQSNADLGTQRRDEESP